MRFDVLSASEFARSPTLDISGRDAAARNTRGSTPRVRTRRSSCSCTKGWDRVAMWRDFPRALCAAAGVRGLVYSALRVRPFDAARRRRRNGRSTSCTRRRTPCCPRYSRSSASRTRRGCSDTATALPSRCCYAAAFPARVAGVVAVAPHVFVEDVSVASIEQARIAYATTDLREKLARYHDDPDSAFRGWNDIWLDPAFRSLEHRGVPAAHPLSGAGRAGRGRRIRNDGADRRHRAARSHARLVNLPACGHSPHRDQPAALTDAVVAFLNEHRQVPVCSGRGGPLMIPGRRPPRRRIRRFNPRGRR